MSKRLQDFSFRVSRYFRPLQPWHCGGMENGQQCALGPDRNGNCRMAGNCEPEHEGHIYKCTRGELLGGKCKAGPGPTGECGQQRLACTPVRNVNSLRYRMALLALVAVTGLALSGLIFDSWRTTTSAGDLSKHHASFGTDDCAACHVTAAQNKSSWVSGLFDPHSEGDVKNCVSCHQMGELPEATHSLVPAALQALTEKSKTQVATGEAGQSSPMMLSAAKMMLGGHQPDLVCADCHQEHKGGDAVITAVSNQQCAVCHQSVFDDFGSHPDFIEYPAERRTRIIFSHNTHILKHFKEEDSLASAPTTCTACHTPDANGQRMEVAGFDQACSSCHSNETNAEASAGDKGIAVLSIPALDIETLNERGIDIGEWPEQSNAELTPMLLLLLNLIEQADPSGGKRNFARLTELELYDLTEASEADLELVYYMAWRTKQLFFELQRSGTGKIREWLNQTETAQRPPTSSPHMWGLLSPNLVDAAVASAFPDLQTESANWLQKGTPVFYIRSPKKTGQKEVAPVQAASSANEDIFGDSDSLEDELSDEDLFADEDLSDDDALNEDDLFAEDGDGAAEQADILDDGDLFAEDGDDAVQQADILDQDSDILPEVGELFLEDGDEEAQDSGQEFTLDDDSGSELFDEDTWDEDSEPGDESTPIGVARLKTVELSPQRSLEDRTNAGGWYWEDFYLRYRPSGHADELIVAWVNFLLEQTNSSLVADNTLLTGFTTDKSPGACLKCHSMESDTKVEPAVLRINWYGMKSVPGHYDFDRFTHRSHFEVSSQIDAAEVQRGCLACHQLDTESDSAASYQETHAAVFSSDFFDLKKDVCLDCHAENEELQSCSLCHNYHVGPRGMKEIFSGLESAAAELDSDQ